MKEDNNSQFSILNSPLIPPGYKQTEVGMIPEDWEVAKLAAVCSMKSGEGITSGVGAERGGGDGRSMSALRFGAGVLEEAGGPI